MKVLIVEDEIAAQQYLCSVLKKYFSDLDILEPIDNVPAAITCIEADEPDILFLDIEIRQGTGFDVLSALPRFAGNIIFTTAYDQFAIEAFRYHAVDYLLKPLEEARIVHALEHIRANWQQKNSHLQIARLLEHLHRGSDHKRIVVPTVDGINFIDSDDILYAQASGNYTILRLVSGAAITTSKKLKDMELYLTLPAFFRIHHSYIANVRYLKKYSKGRGGYVTLTGSVDLPVSPARKDDFLKFIHHD